MEHKDILNLNKLSEKMQSDIYYAKEVKRLVKSCCMVDGIIAKEVDTIHTEEFKRIYSVLVFSSVCKRGKLFEASKENFLLFCSELYDREVGLKSYHEGIP